MLTQRKAHHTVQDIPKYMIMPEAATETHTVTWSLSPHLIQHVDAATLYTEGYTSLNENMDGRCEKSYSDALALNFTPRHADANHTPGVSRGCYLYFSVDVLTTRYGTTYYTYT